MSEALMTFQPRMLDPSNPRPSVKISSLYSVSVVVKCCQLPGRSVNLKSTSLTSRSLINLLTSEAVFFSLAMGSGEGNVLLLNGYIVTPSRQQMARCDDVTT